MKVVFIYRSRRRGGHSIEELFHTIACELGKQIDVIEYEVGGFARIPMDVFKLRKLDADIYHVTGDVHYFISLLLGKKSVLTIHDIWHYLNGLSGIKRWIFKWFWLVFPIRNASAVTSISIESRNNLIRHIDVKAKRVEVIENCYSAIFKPMVKEFDVECPTILQLGTKALKNVPRLVEALSGLNCRLIIIGTLDNEIKQKLIECKVPYENYVAMSHEEIYNRYVECDIVSFVSLSEGFGVPIIEAQAVGRPLITSNLSPMNYVAGEGACLVDPRDVMQIREAILRINVDPVYRDQLIKHGFRNVNRYSPSAISAQYHMLYKSLMSV